MTRCPAPGRTSFPTVVVSVALTAAAAGVASFTAPRPSAASDVASVLSPAAAPASRSTVGTGEAVDADPVLVGAGDIAKCTSSGDEATAKLLDGIPGTVFTAGDNAYDNGSATDFAKCYEPSWGRHKARTKPAVGNHEYRTPRASGHFRYFGAAAGPPDKGYYSFNLGTWHILVINSNCDQIGGCHAGSVQERWVRADLAANRTRCTAAIWHHPLFTSGTNHGPATEMRPIYKALYDARAEVVLTGHNHHYERFAPQNPKGSLDRARGIRQFVVGMGGGSHYGFGKPRPNSQARNGDTYGVLKLTLRAGAYDWRFVPEAGRSYADRGTGTCR